MDINIEFKVENAKKVLEINDEIEKLSFFMQIVNGQRGQPAFFGQRLSAASRDGICTSIEHYVLEKIQQLKLDMTEIEL